MAKATPLKGLGPSTRVCDAAQLILGLRLADVRRFENGFDPKIKPDDIHDMRVATRRLRAALQLLGVSRTIERQVKRFQDGLGGVRDLHVQREWVVRTAEDTSRHSTRALKKLRQSIDEALPAKEAVFRDELERWKSQTVNVVRSAAAKVSGTEKLGGPEFRELLKKRIRQIQKGLESFSTSTDAKTAHKLRIRVKKLRYLAEILESVWPEKIRSLLQALVPLQEVFGHLHDADVRIAQLTAQAAEDDQPNSEVLKLLEHVESERGSLVDEAATIVLRWRADHLGRDLRRQFSKSASVQV